MAATTTQMVQLGVLSQQLCSRGPPYGEAQSIMKLWRLFDDVTGFCDEPYRRLVCMTLLHNDPAVRAALSAQHKDYGHKGCYTQQLFMEYIFVVECACYFLMQVYDTLAVLAADRVEHLTLSGPHGLLPLFTLMDLSDATMHGELRILRGMATLSALCTDPMAIQMTMQSRQVIAPILTLLPMDVYDALLALDVDHPMVRTMRGERSTIMGIHDEFVVRLRHKSRLRNPVLWHVHQTPDVTMRSIFQSGAPLHMMTDAALELYMNCVQHAHKNHVAVKTVAPSILRCFGFFSKKPSCWDLQDERVLGVHAARLTALLQTKFLAESAYVHYGIAMNVLREDLGNFYCGASMLLDFPDFDFKPQSDGLRIFAMFAPYRVHDAA
jgi:hypothetical protein